MEKTNRQKVQFLSFDNRQINNVVNSLKNRFENNIFSDLKKI